MEAIDVLLQQWQKIGVTTEEVALRFSTCILYVTCEPCIMCASALSIIGMVMHIYLHSVCKFLFDTLTLSWHFMAPVSGIKEVYYGLLSLHTKSSGKLTRFDTKLIICN
ncbi:hypothetical protein MIMGU_mgv1a020933mg, partial [Erythranthe guttata]